MEDGSESKTGLSDKEMNEVPPLETIDIVLEKRKLFRTMLRWVQKDVARTNYLKGFSRHERNTAEMIALMHSELSEMLEAYRSETWKKDLCDKPMLAAEGIKAVEEEAADVLIRLLDFCAVKELRLAKALFAKMEYNKTRPWMHGGKSF